MRGLAPHSSPDTCAGSESGVGTSLDSSGPGLDERGTDPIQAGLQGAVGIRAETDRLRAGESHPPAGLHRRERHRTVLIRRIATPREADRDECLFVELDEAGGHPTREGTLRLHGESPTALSAFPRSETTKTHITRPSE